MGSAAPIGTFVTAVTLHSGPDIAAKRGRRQLLPWVQFTHLFGGSIAACYTRRGNMARKVLNLGLLAALAAAAGCTTMGLGVGSTAAGKDPVEIQLDQLGQCIGCNEGNRGRWQGLCGAVLPNHQ